MPKIEERKKERIRSFFRSFLKKISQILRKLQYILPQTDEGELLKSAFFIVLPFLFRKSIFCQKYEAQISYEIKGTEKGTENGTKIEQKRNEVGTE